MNYLKNLKWEMIIFSVLSITMGVLMVIYPDKILTVICSILAAILFVIGIRYIIEYKRRNAVRDFFRYELVFGIIFIVGGIIVLAFMKNILSILTYAVAIIIIVSGLMKIENSLDLRRMGERWMPLLVFAVICVLLGISVLMMPMNNNDDGTRTAGDFFIQCTGAIFALSGFIDLITTLAVSGKIKAWVKEVSAPEERGSILYDYIDDDEIIYEEADDEQEK